MITAKQVTRKQRSNLAAVVYVNDEYPSEQDMKEADLLNEIDSLVYFIQAKINELKPLLEMDKHQIKRLVSSLENRIDYGEQEQVDD
ncbi:MAG: hypothetical protein DRP42_02660 [Tenericutes bacterium]|nr:MAG: hypothetical protein DRP42_02660 [Mycoplasmatota bacterium]